MKVTVSVRDAGDPADFEQRLNGWGSSASAYGLVAKYDTGDRVAFSVNPLPGWQVPFSTCLAKWLKRGLRFYKIGAEKIENGEENDK